MVFGSINADVVTSVDQHPSQGETVSGSSYIVLLGGKGANQALAACKSGSAIKMLGAVVIHNAAPAKTIPKAVLSNIDHLVVNESEVILVAQSLGYDGAEHKDAARFIQAISKNAVIVTLGDKGAFSTIENEEFEVSSLAVEVADTTGAGDAFVGAFAAALDQGKDFLIALRHGVVAGSLACRSVGAQSSIPDLEEVALHITD